MSATGLLFDDLPEASRASAPAQDHGVLPYQHLRALAAGGLITAPEEAPIEAGQFQPASLDLRLADKAYRVQTSFLTGYEHRVTDRLAELSLYELDLTGDGAVLERGCVYIVPLMEGLRLGRSKKHYYGIATPKSSTGRLDVFARLVVDQAREFERVPRGYNGPLYLEVSPRTFAVRVRQGDRLAQLRLRRRADVAHGPGQLRNLHRRLQIAEDDAQVDISNGLWVTVDLDRPGGDGPVAYRARRHAGVIDLRKVGQHPVNDFWEPVHADARRRVILNPDDFYIFASKQRIAVPPDQSAEMVPYETTVGEFRAHYAGFFDPGFGTDGSRFVGTPAVLEVRSHEVPFLLEHDQPVARLVYEPLIEAPDITYGPSIGANYARQGLTLGKHFCGS